MKKTLLLTLFTLIAVCIYAQDIDQKNVPAVVLNAFQLKFANADDVDWELEKGVFHVDFELNDKKNEVWMDETGKISKHRQELWESEVPLEIIQTIRTKCKYFDLDKAVVNEEEGKAVYYIKFEIDNKDCEFWTERNGKLLEFRKELKDSEIPASIMDPLKAKYPSLDIDDAELKEEAGKVFYYLKAEVNDKDNFFWYDGSGKLLKHQRDLRNSEIPPAVMNSISVLYAGFEIRDSDMIQEDRAISYDIELRKSKERITVIFNEKGEVLKSTKK